MTSRSEYVELNYVMIAEKRIRKNVHGCSHGLIRDTATEFVWKD